LHKTKISHELHEFTRIKINKIRVFRVYSWLIRHFAPRPFLAGQTFAGHIASHLQ